MTLLLLTIIVVFIGATNSQPSSIAVSTWAFTTATDAAWAEMHNRSDAKAVDLVQAGCAACEQNRCDGTVGEGGSPDENGETTLDAMIMCGTTMNAGAVGALRQIPDAIAVARGVMEATRHSMLCGSQASDFAEITLGMARQSLSSEQSKAIYNRWRNDFQCQPNFWSTTANLTPQSSIACGPYKLLAESAFECGHPERTYTVHPQTHDTISMVAIYKGDVASATSTNGASHKIAGRVGDGPIIGSGSYADSTVGGCGSTGDGDIMMRFLPCYQTVENMRLGMTPTQAAQDAINRIAKKFPDFSGAVIAVNVAGDHGAATHGFEKFPYSYRRQQDPQSFVTVVFPHQKNIATQ